MKEFRIIQQHRNGKPFSPWTFNNFESCYSQLLILIENTGNYFHRDYYVFNNFYENEFTTSASEKFKIEVRDVGAWETYEKEEQIKNSKKIIKIY